MVWVIVVVAVLVLALAAWVGTGRLGEMPEVVGDRPRGRVPEGPLDGAFLERLVLPLAPTGYDPSQVDTYLDEVVDGDAAPVTEVQFDTVRRGYDMQVVDAILDRVPGAHEARRVAGDDPEDVAPEGDDGEDSEKTVVEEATPEGENNDADAVPARAEEA